MILTQINAWINKYTQYMFDKNRFISLFEESEAAEVIDKKRAIEDYKDVQRLSD